MAELQQVEKIAGIVLAAGMSLRMGTSKMALSWGDSTVLGTVLATLHKAGLEDLRVVVGASQELVVKITEAMPFPVGYVFNPDYANGEMLDSIKRGLDGIGEDACAALIALGDQPQIEEKVVKRLLEKHVTSHSHIILPSYHFRRGHPWIINCALWDEIRGMGAGQTMRDFFNKYAGDINYLIVDTPSVLQDIDTPEDYRKAQKAKN